jgi:hypothetical protein
MRMKKISSLKIFLIQRLGGFVDIDEALDSISDSKERRYILTRAVKRLFNTIGSEDILKVHDTGQWMFQGRELNEAQKSLLISEAQNFLSTSLWKVLQADIKYQANRKMFILGGDDLQITAGKLWLITLDAFKQRLENMKLGKGNFNDKS